MHMDIHLKIFTKIHIYIALFGVTHPNLISFVLVWDRRLLLKSQHVIFVVQSDRMMRAFIY